MKDIFEYILMWLFTLAVIFIFTWIIFGVYFEDTMQGVCHWYTIVVMGFLIWVWLSGN